MATNTENVYIIQPITRENGGKYRVLHDEAVSLIESAGAQYAGTIYQTIREINAATFIGSGKLEELNERLYGLDDITVLFNGELSPSQTLNISAALQDRKVIDRTTLILDIFAKNAKSNEGKLQVELAQLKYLYPRLKGKGAALSRLGGGVGTRGPGETQLETDRRYIRGRLQYLEKRLSELKKRRGLWSARRKKDDVKTVALVGYTNTGKSTLLQDLTGEETFIKDALFATLDTTSRQFTVNGVPFLLVDTVGFLQDLPHDLIDAFQSTLESALECDLALIVCDATGEFDMQLQTMLDTLRSLQCTVPYIVVMNKAETVDTAVLPYGSIPISAKEKLGLERLKREILRRFDDQFTFCRLFVPYAKWNAYASVQPLLTERNVSFTDEGKIVDVVLPSKYADKITEFIDTTTNSTTP